MYQRPVIKSTLPVYRLNNDIFRIGAQAGITSEFNDPDCEMWDLIKLMDGSDIEQIVVNLQRLHPNLTEGDILKGLELLDNQGFLDNYMPETDISPRYRANVAYFAAFPHTSSERAAKMQRKLNNSKVLLLGLGGGGSNILTLVAGLGFSKITIVDYDTVEVSNLGRQLLYKESDIGRPKTEAAKDNFLLLNSQTEIISINKKINSSKDVESLIDDNDIVICALDEPQFLAQRWVNKAIVKSNVPCVFGASQLTHGRVFSVFPHKTGCFDCLHLYYTQNDSQFIDQFRGFHNIDFEPPTVAYAPAMWEVAACMADEAVRIVTNYVSPQSLGVQFELTYPDYSSFSRPAWPRYDYCPTCGNGNYHDWEIFNYYNDRKKNVQ